MMFPYIFLVSESVRMPVCTSNGTWRCEI